MIINCVICNKEFEAKPSEIKKNKRFCSQRCYHTWRKTIHNPWSQSEKTTKVCLYCKGKFIVTPCHILRKYCSHKCAMIHLHQTKFKEVHNRLRGKSLEEIHGKDYAKVLRKHFSEVRKGRVFSEEHKKNLSLAAIKRYAK